MFVAARPSTPIERRTGPPRHLSDPHPCIVLRALPSEERAARPFIAQHQMPPVTIASEKDFQSPRDWYAESALRRESCQLICSSWKRIRKLTRKTGTARQRVEESTMRAVQRETTWGEDDRSAEKAESYRQKDKGTEYTQSECKIAYENESGFALRGETEDIHRKKPWRSCCWRPTARVS